MQAGKVALLMGDGVTAAFYSDRQDFKLIISATEFCLPSRACEPQVYFIIHFTIFKQLLFVKQFMHNSHMERLICCGILTRPNWFRSIAPNEPDHVQQFTAYEGTK